MKHFLSVFLWVLSLSLFLVALVLGTLYLYGIVTPKQVSVNNTEGEKAKTVILDAGHGGIDGGAVGLYGTLEKELNLDLAQKLAKLLEAQGVSVVLTRCDDALLTTEGASTRKSGDLQARAKIANETENGVFVSIHMNRFPQESVKGITLYYSPNHVDGRRFAEAVMNGVVDRIQPENKRPIKEADDSLYLLSHISCPAILVECGFLSNPYEAALLADDAYRARLAEVLRDAILTYLDE